MRLALVGQPNCGKSTIFNAVAGYRAVAANYPGKTVETLSSRISWEGGELEILDLPGIYSLTAPSAEESEARAHLFASRPSAILHIVDASVLHRSLELTIELLDLGLPMVVGLNMMDEAERKGVIIDIVALSSALGVPVVPMIASRGEGIESLFRAGRFAALNRVIAKPMRRSQATEDSVAKLSSFDLTTCAARLGMSPRFLALQLLESDPDLTRSASELSPELAEAAARERAALVASGQTTEIVLAAERHALATALFEKTAKVRQSRPRDWRERIDDIMVHPVWGYPILGLVLALLFITVFCLGETMEDAILACCEDWPGAIHDRLGHNLEGSIAEGIAQGFISVCGLVIPYLIPFLLALAFLEDIGYLPRVAFLMDAFMHRLGLHGKAIIPLVLGYGCTSPAIMSAKILENRRDRLIAAILVNFIPCAARSTVIFALIGFTMGPWYALGVYLINLLAVALVGRVFSRLHPEASLGMILELPTYKMPGLRTMAAKTWLRLRDFIVLACPILIVSSAVLSILQYYGGTEGINAALAPFVVNVLGLPADTGMLLVLGILRKEMTIVMLSQALGTSDWQMVLSPVQIAVFTMFVVFYVPCVATLAMTRTVIGTKAMIASILINTSFAVILALATRAVFAASWALIGMMDSA